jgi:hypothetical protein
VASFLASAEQPAVKAARRRAALNSQPNRPLRDPHETRTIKAALNSLRAPKLRFADAEKPAPVGAAQRSAE